MIYAFELVALLGAALLAAGGQRLLLSRRQHLVARRHLFLRGSRAFTDRLELGLLRVGEVEALHHLPHARVALAALTGLAALGDLILGDGEARRGEEPGADGNRKAE